MARPVYSYRFFDNPGFEGTLTFDVPTDKVAIIRDIDAYWVLGLTGSTLQAMGTAGATFAQLAWQVETDTSSVKSWRGRQVIEAGGTLVVVTESALDVSVSGYLLDAP